MTRVTWPWLARSQVKVTQCCSVFIWDPWSKIHAKQNNIHRSNFSKYRHILKCDCSQYFDVQGVKMTPFSVIWRHNPSFWLYYVGGIYSGEVTEWFQDILIFTWQRWKMCVRGYKISPLSSMRVNLRGAELEENSKVEQLLCTLW